MTSCENSDVILCDLSCASQYCAMMMHHFLPLPLSPPSSPYLFISHSAAPLRACSVATAGVWMSLAHQCLHVPTKTVFYPAMESET